MIKHVKFFLFVSIGGIVVYVSLFLLFPSYDDPYGCIEIDRTPFVILRETQKKSWLCIRKGYEYFKVVDSCPVKEFYCNDSIAIAKIPEIRFWKQDTVYYLIKYSQLDCSIQTTECINNRTYYSIVLDIMSDSITGHHVVTPYY